MPLSRARCSTAIPREKRVVVDLWGRYNDTIRVEHDFNHLEKLDGHLGWEWDEAFRAISDTILQPTLEPRRADVGSFLFHGFEPDSVVVRTRRPARPPPRAGALRNALRRRCTSAATGSAGSRSARSWKPTRQLRADGRPGVPDRLGLGARARTGPCRQGSSGHRYRSGAAARELEVEVKRRRPLRRGASATCSASRSSRRSSTARCSAISAS